MYTKAYSVTVKSKTEKTLNGGHSGFNTFKAAKQWEVSRFHWLIERKDANKLDLPAYWAITVDDGPNGFWDDKQ